VAWSRPRQPRTIGQIDVDTPVADLHDADDAGRDGLVMFSDEQRERLAWLLSLFEDTRNRALLQRSLEATDTRDRVVRMRSDRRRWYEHWTARAVAVLAALAAAGSMLAQWVQLARGR